MQPDQHKECHQIFEDGNVYSHTSTERQLILTEGNAYLDQHTKSHSYQRISILFKAVSFHCRKKPSARVFHRFLSFAILVHTPPCCPTMSSLQRRFGLPTDLTPSVCHSVLLIVHLLSFIRAMCPARFHFVLVTYRTMPVTLDFFA